MVEVPDYWLTFLVATVLPALVALVSKRYATASFKGVLLAALSAVTGVLTSVQMTGGELDLKVAFTNFIVAFVTAVTVHYGLLKPTGVTGSDGAIAENVPGGAGPEAK